MRRRLSLNAVIVVVSAAVALVLTVTRPSPEGLISVGMGGPEVRAAPGTPSSSINRHNLTALEVFSLTLVRVRDSYVDPVRISPKKMLYAALDSVQFDVPEVLVEAHKNADQVIVQVNNKRQRFSTRGVDSPWRLAGKLKKVFRFIEANMNPGADLAKVEYAAVNGMLRTLDPHSVLLDPETAREMNVSTSGYFGGLGIVIRMYKNKLTVVRPIKDTPAQRAGIKRADHIAKINGEVTENLTLQEAVERMRGKAGTKVTIWVARKGHQNLLRYDITRARIRVDSVEYKMLPKKIGYIRIKQFSGRTAKETKEALAKMRAKGAKAWVLDLRWNPGGLLEQAIQVADLFLDNGTIVTTVGGQEREPRRARRRGTDAKSPVAVLVNGSSASASEIVAGALKNRDRAVVIGTTTFGKGSVQILYDNKDGSKLKLTIAQYLTPGDQSIQSVGVTPDIELHRMLVPKQNKTPKHQVRLLRASHRYREADLSAHLTSRYAKKASRPKYVVNYLYEPTNKQTALDDETDPFDEDAEPLDDELVIDFPIQFARDVAAAATKADRKRMIRDARKILTSLRSDQAKKLTTALSALNVDWSNPAAKTGTKPQLSAQITVNPSRVVNAGDTVEVTGTVTNTGTTPAHRLHARIKSDYGVFEDSELIFGKIDAGQTRTWTTRIRVPDAADDRVAVLNLRWREAHGATMKVAPIKLRIKAAVRPVFSYSHQLIDLSGKDVAGNGDGLVQKGEQLKLRVTVRNSGQGKAKSTTAVLRNTTGDGLRLKKARFDIGELAPGQEVSRDFLFQVTKELRSKYLHLELGVYDSVLHESVKEKLKYRVRSASAGPAKMSGSARVARRHVTIYEGASGDSARIGHASRGAQFRVTGRQGGWTRVMLDSGRPGFIASRALKRARLRAGRVAYSRNMQVTPPSLSLQIPSYETTKASYSLRGTATDNSKIEDVYIFVSNRSAKVDNRKVFYKSNRGGKNARSMRFDARVPLFVGSNRVTVVVRENDEVKSSHTMYLYRNGQQHTASASR